MSASTAAVKTTGVKYGGSFWERLWRLSGINFVVFAVVAYALYGFQPGVGAPVDTLVQFYSGERTRILIAAIVAGMAVLNLLWFAAALRTLLANAGQDGWGAAVTASSTAVGVLLLVLVTAGAALAYSIAGDGDHTLAPGLNDLSWACLVLSSFPRAMLIMSGTFGLWRAGVISNSLFALGVAALVLVLLGGTTWVGGGVWAPDGAYSRFVSPAIGFAWVLVVSRIVLTRIPTSGANW